VRPWTRLRGLHHYRLPLLLLLLLPLLPRLLRHHQLLELSGPAALALEEAVEDGEPEAAEVEGLVGEEEAREAQWHEVGEDEEQ
jgi:hypothetical protein